MEDASSTGNELVGEGTPVSVSTRDAPLVEGKDERADDGMEGRRFVKGFDDEREEDAG